MSDNTKDKKQRPVYETSSDRKQERDAADMFAKFHGVGIEYQPKFAAIDCVLVGDDIIRPTVMEVKCRKIKWGQYPTIILSGMKFAMGMDRVRRGGRFLFLVRAYDEMRVYDATPASLRAVRNDWGGRVDRDSPEDMEWVVHIPIVMFKRISQIRLCDKLDE